MAQEEKALASWNFLEPSVSSHQIALKLAGLVARYEYRRPRFKATCCQPPLSQVSL